MELMLSSGANVIIWDKMLSSGMKCYHLELMLSSGANVIIWDEMLSSGANVIIWDKMLSFGANVIIWDEMLSSGMKCYHLELMLSSGVKCYHLELMFFLFFIYCFGWRCATLFTFIFFHTIHYRTQLDHITQYMMRLGLADVYEWNQWIFLDHIT